MKNFFSTKEITEKVIDEKVIRYTKLALSTRKAESDAREALIKFSEVEDRYNSGIGRYENYLLQQNLDGLKLKVTNIKGDVKQGRENIRVLEADIEQKIRSISFYNDMIRRNTLDFRQALDEFEKTRLWIEENNKKGGEKIPKPGLHHRMQLEANLKSSTSLYQQFIDSAEADIEKSREEIKKTEDMIDSNRKLLPDLEKRVSELSNKIGSAGDRFEKNEAQSFRKEVILRKWALDSAENKLERIKSANSEAQKTIIKYFKDESMQNIVLSKVKRLMDVEEEIVEDLITLKGEYSKKKDAATSLNTNPFTKRAWSLEKEKIKNLEALIDYPDLRVAYLENKKAEKQKEEDRLKESFKSLPESRASESSISSSSISKHNPTKILKNTLRDSSKDISPFEKLITFSDDPFVDFNNFDELLKNINSLKTPHFFRGELRYHDGDKILFSFGEEKYRREENQEKGEGKKENQKKNGELINFRTIAFTFEKNGKSEDGKSSSFLKLLNDIAAYTQNSEKPEILFKLLIAPETKRDTAEILQEYIFNEENVKGVSIHITQKALGFDLKEGQKLDKEVLQTYIAQLLSESEKEKVELGEGEVEVELDEIGLNLKEVPDDKETKNFDDWINHEVGLNEINFNFLNLKEVTDDKETENFADLIGHNEVNRVVPEDDVFPDLVSDYEKHLLNNLKQEEGKEEKKEKEDDSKPSHLNANKNEVRGVIRTPSADQLKTEDKQNHK